jgi:hypothetical protein
MTEQENNASSKNSNESESAAAKKQYKDPAFRYEHVFETMALACGKVEPTNISCRFNRRNS